MLMITVSDEMASLIVDCRNTLGEMPLWDASAGALYWIDVVPPGRVFHWSRDANLVDFWQFDDLVTGLNLADQGGLVIHHKNKIIRFDSRTSECVPIFALPTSADSMRFNDGHCDAVGRLWLGTMPNNISAGGAPIAVSERSGQILVIGNGVNRTYEAGLGCPNAVCWSPDGRTFYIADSCDGWLYAYSFDCDSGTISERRPFCYLEGLGIPDGAAVDLDGCIWNARWGAGVIVRITPQGKLDRIIRAGVSQPTACCFGGSDRKTLFVTSARFGLTAEQLTVEPYAGGVFEINANVAGVELPNFAG